jgi:hypothetical protein
MHATLYLHRLDWSSPARWGAGELYTPVLLLFLILIFQIMFLPLVSLELCTKYVVRGMRYEVRGTGCEVRGTRYEVQGTWYEVWGTWYEVHLLGILD